MITPATARPTPTSIFDEPCLLAFFLFLPLGFSSSSSSPSSSSSSRKRLAADLPLGFSSSSAGAPFGAALAPAALIWEDLPLVFALGASSSPSSASSGGGGGALAAGFTAALGGPAATASFL